MTYSNLYAQLASFCFLMSAVFSDLLLLRFCLVLANALLVVAASVGFPLWPDFVGTGVAVDTLVWSSVALTLHIWAFVRLLLDERPIPPFKNPNDEALFQYFNARSGIGRSDFLEILEKAEWVSVPEVGRLIPCEDHLYVIVEGAIECKIRGWKRRPGEEAPEGEEEIMIGSGELFDLSLANVFGLPIGFYNQGFEARTLTGHALLASWDKAALEGFAYRSPPIVPSAWKNLVAFAVADVAHRQRRPGETLQRSKRHADFSPPPEAMAPKKRPSCWAWTKTFFIWIFTSMDPRPPKGLRHYAVPRQFVVTSDLQRTAVEGHGNNGNGRVDQQGVVV